MISTYLVLTRVPMLLPWLSLKPMCGHVQQPIEELNHLLAGGRKCIVFNEKNRRRNGQRFAEFATEQGSRQPDLGRFVDCDCSVSDGSGQRRVQQADRMPADRLG